MHPCTPQAAATAFLALGYQPTPVVFGGKRPITKGWQSATITEQEVPALFSGRTNIGILLGAPSGGLVDVDIDSETAARLTDALPATGMAHGRADRPVSHFWYQIEGELPPTTQYKHPITGEMIIELRSTGAQTVTPPSQYANEGCSDSECSLLTWASYTSPGRVSACQLESAVATIAAATVVADAWPQKGSRHQMALALAGMLLRGGQNQQSAEQFMELVCRAADDEEVEDRVRAVIDTAEKISTSAPATGVPTLAQLMDVRLLTQITKWLNLKANQSSSSLPWEPPLTFDRIVTPEIPSSLLPGVMGDFAGALARSAEVSESMATMSVLGILSAACAKNFVVSPQEGWNEPVNLYILSGLPPANNKSLIQSSCTAPIDAWEARKHQQMEADVNLARSKRKNEESLIQSLRMRAAKSRDASVQQQLFADVSRLESSMTEIPVLPQIYLNDVTPESLSAAVCEQGGRIAIISDEGGIMETMAGLYSKGHANYDILLKGIDGGRVRLARKDRAIDVYPYLTFLLVVQPQIIRNMADKRSFQGRGLLERFLYVLPQSRLGYRSLEQNPIPTAITKSYRDAIGALLDIQPLQENGLALPRRLTLSDEAKRAWKGFRHEIEIQLREDGKLSPCLGWGGKLAGFTLRIAALIEISATSGRCTDVGTTAMANAVTLARLLADHAVAAFSMMKESPAEEDAQAILSWLHKTQATTFRRTDCLRKFHGRFTSKGRFDASLQVLTDRGYISPERQETTTVGKRATRFYDVNPYLLGSNQPE